MALLLARMAGRGAGARVASAALARLTASPAPARTAAFQIPRCGAVHGLHMSACAKGPGEDEVRTRSPLRLLPLTVATFAARTFAALAARTRGRSCARGKPGPFPKGFLAAGFSTPAIPFLHYPRRRSGESI